MRVLESISLAKNPMTLQKEKADMSKRLLQRIFTAFAMLILFAPSATAHTSVVKTIPAYKSTISEMPQEISIEFTEELMTLGEKEINVITISNPNGEELLINQLSVRNRSLIATLSKQEFQEGTYLISYRVVSADGHGVSGSYEIYLNHPTSKDVRSVVEHEEHGGFFHIHRTHLTLAGAALIVIFLWWAYRRFTLEDRD